MILMSEFILWSFFLVKFIMFCRLYALALTVCSYPKVAILPLNFKRRTAFQIYDKLSYEERTRHFWVGAVMGEVYSEIKIKIAVGILPSIFIKGELYLLSPFLK